MSNPQEITARQKALALAALAKGIVAFAHDNNGEPTGLWMIDLYSVAVAMGDKWGRDEQVDILNRGYPSAIEALAATAEALGLEPDPILQRHEQTRPVLTESQRESLLIVAEVAGDLAVNAEAVEIGGRSAPSAAELLAWAEELEQPVRTLHALFDLAPKESTSTSEGRPQE